MVDSFTEELVEFVFELKEREDSTRTMRAASLAIADTLAVAVAGCEEPASTQAREWSALAKCQDGHAIWGTADATSVGEAVLVNGISSHTLDLDDALPTMRGHPSAVLVPALVALAQVAESTGRQLLEAYVIGVETLGLLGQALGNRHYEVGWHSTSTIGTIGVAIAAAGLLSLDRAATRNAIGIAASQAAGLRRNFGTTTKALHSGQAARAGLLSAWLASRGATADSTVLDGKGGFLDVYSADSENALAVLAKWRDADRPWQLEDPGLSVKRWACCLANYRPLAGLIELLERSEVDSSEIEEIRVGFLPGADSALVHQNPMTGLEAKFSVEYVLAATAIDGELRTTSFADEMVNRTDVRRLMSKVKRFEMPADRTYSGSGNDGFTDVELRARGKSHAVRIDRVPGSGAWPLSEAELTAKFSDCLSAKLGPGKGPELLALALELSNAPSTQNLTDFVTLG